MLKKRYTATAMLFDTIWLSRGRQVATRQHSIEKKIITSLVTIPSWDELSDQITHCTQCSLTCNKRYAVTRPLQHVTWMLIQQSPTTDTDELLNTMINNIPLAGGVYCTTATKCTSEPRYPDYQQLVACREYVLNEIYLVKPKIIIVFGRAASNVIIGQDMTLKSLRSTLHTVYFNREVFTAVVTYDLCAVLRNKNLKSLVWEDIKFAMRHLNAAPNI